MAKGQLSKIYRLEATGFSVIHNQFNTLSDDLTKIKRLMLDLQGQKLTATGRELQNINAAIVETAKVEGVLETKIKEVEVSQKTSVSTISKITQGYIAAKKAIQDLTAQFGVNSAQVKQATADMALYKTQLAEVLALLGSAGFKTAASIQKATTVVTKELTGAQALLNAEIAESNRVNKLKAAVDNSLAGSEEHAAASIKFLEYQQTILNKTTESGIKKYQQLQVEIEKLRLIASKGVTTPAVGAVTPGVQTTAPVPVVTEANVTALNEETAALHLNEEAFDAKRRAEAEDAIASTEWQATQAVVVTETVQTDAAIVETKLAYDEYTGTLRQNIVAQIENERALLLNRTAQKELEATVLSTAGGTEAQTLALATLREEELLLVESNKALSLTLRNQSKEFTATIGSLNEARAQLNLLTQAYADLSVAEQQSPFGQQLVQQINILDPKIKELEAEIGQFFRNVGNYPQVFGSAFTVLTKQLGEIQAKISSGAFKGNDLLQLQARETSLINATKVLNTEFSSITAKANAYKKVGAELGVVFGTNSVVFKEFQAQVAASSIQIDKAAKKMNDLSAGGDKAVKTFKGFYGFLRTLANILPGAGISTLLLLIPTAATAAYDAFAKVKKASEILKDAQRDVEDAAKKATIAVAEQIVKIQLLYDVTQNGKAPLEERISATKQFLEVVKEHNIASGDHIKFLRDENGILIANKDAYDELTGSIEKQAKAKAVITVLGEAYEKLLKAETSTLNSQTSLVGDILSTIDEKLFGGGGVIGRQIRLKAKGIADAKTYKDGVVTTIKSFVESGEFSIDQLFGQGKPGGQSKLSTFIQEEFKKIDTIQKTALAVENTYVNNTARLRKLTFDEEIKHIKAIEKINVDALNAKIAILSKQKSLNNEEALTLAEFGEQISAIQLENSKKINDIEKKRFESSLKDLQLQLEVELNEIDANNKAVQLATEKTDTEKANAQFEADAKVIDSRQKFYDALLLLNGAYNAESLAKAREGIQTSTEAIIADNKRILDAQIKDANSALEIRRAIARQITADKTIEVLNSGKGASQIARELLKVQADAARELAAQDLGNQQAELRLYELGKKGKLRTEEEYQKALAKYKEDEASLIKATADENLNAYEKFLKVLRNFKDVFVENILGIKQYAKTIEGEQQKTADATKQAQDAIKQSVNEAYANYFTNENARIDKEKEANISRLDNQQKIAEGTAQSEAERETIAHQFDLKRQAAEKKAGEEKKKLALKQLTIDYAIAVIKSLAQYGLPLALIPIAAETALYFVQRANINKQQFAKGGIVHDEQRNTFVDRVFETTRRFAFGGSSNEVPVRGGEFGGREHSKGGTDFSYKGKTYNAEVKELAVIRTRNAPANKKFTVTGTQMQIASAANVIGGGKQFRAGAKVVQFDAGGFLGSNLQAPEFTPASTNTAAEKNNEEVLKRFDELTDATLKNIDATNARFDRLSVVQDTRTVSDALNKQAKQSKVASL